jgi:hypothetical protein
MELEGSLLRPQEHSIGPYPESDQTVHTATPCLSNTCFSITESRTSWSGLPTNIVYVLHVLPIVSRSLDHSNYTWRNVQIMKLLVCSKHF